VKANNIVVGDFVQYKIEKGTFTKGYAIPYSNDIHRVVSVSHQKAKLDNQTECKFENLQKDPVGSALVEKDTTSLQMVEKDAKRRRLLAKARLLFSFYIWNFYVISELV
jgi:hypothetical protein